MAKLYREQVLGEKPAEPGLISIGSIAPAHKPATAPVAESENAEETVMGD